jgi:YVTN family beta-propeller protein
MLYCYLSNAARCLRFYAVILTLLAGTAHAAPFVYITNQNSSTVSVIDIATNTVVDTVTVGPLPYGVAVNPAGTRAYVGNAGSNTVSVIDTASNTVVATVTVGTTPYGIAVNPAGTRAYVANNGNANVSVIDTANNTVVATVTAGINPYGVAVNPAGTRAYVGNAGSNTVSVIDTANNTVVATVTVGSNPVGVAVNPAGTRAYVANSAGGNSVSVIDTASNTVVATVTVGTTPGEVAVNPAGTRVYAANFGSNNVSVIDTASNTVVDTVAVGTNPLGVAVNPAGTRAYVANFGSNNVSVIDTATNTVVATVPVGSGPVAFGLFITPVAVQSRKAHAAAGAFDLAIDTTQPIGGPVTVEPRAIGTGHQIVFQFNVPVNSIGAASAIDGAGAPAGTVTASMAGSEAIVTLTGVPDNQRVTVSVFNVNGIGLNATASLGFLVGDVNNSRSVTATDILQVKGRSGQVTDATNFRFDLNASGSITASDILAVKGRSGLVLGTTPPPTTHLMINELSTAGINASDEFVEIFNTGATAVDVTNWSLVYRSAAGTTDILLGTFSGALPPGAYALAAGVSFLGPTPDILYGTAGGILSSVGGGVALRDAFGNIVDSVGYGTATNAFVEGTAAAAPPTSSSIARFPNGTDTGNNAADFQVRTRTPKAANQ